MDLRRQTVWLAVAAAASIGALALVHGLQSFGGYLPCELCLKQREVYWVALGLAIVGLLIGRARRGAIPVATASVGVAFAVGFLVAGYHAGVEWKWWPGPATCTGGGAGPVHAADMAAVLNGSLKLHMVRCDEAALRIAGLSLSGWNALASLALSVASFALLKPSNRV